MSVDYFDDNLLRVVKDRVFRELEDSLQQHSGYRDRVNVYHKFPYKERPMFGVVLKNASATRMRLSADDYAATASSYVSLARAQGKEGRILKWVWEDEYGITTVVKDEDVSSQLTGSASFGTNRVFQVQNPPIMAGQYVSEIADNFRQISVKVNGEKTFAEYVDGKKGIVILPTAPPADATVLISYWKKNIVSEGRYYLQLIDNDHFVIDPIYIVESEEVIDKTTGTETTTSLDNGNLLDGFDVLYTKKYDRSESITLVKDTDYTLETDGTITFLNPLPTDTTLYANYRWIGTRLGPFDMPENDFRYNNTALPGIIMAFSSERIVGDKNVIIVYPKREVSAKVYSGHWTMTFDIDVMARDTVQLPELTDHLINDMWSRKRISLTLDGLTLESMEPTGEYEEIYDENTGEQYYKNSVNLTLISEYKKFVPYLTEIMDYTYSLYQVSPIRFEYDISKDGRIFESQLVPYSKPFVVKYPTSGYVRYF